MRQLSSNKFKKIVLFIAYKVPLSKFLLSLWILPFSLLVAGQSISKTYSTTISNLCSNRTCNGNFPTLSFDLPDGFADHHEVTGIDVTYEMSSDCDLTNFSRVVCNNTDLASPIQQGRTKNSSKIVSYNNLSIANGIYSKSTNIEFQLELTGGSCFCYSTTCDIIASTWTMTLYYNPIYYNSICEIADYIQPSQSPCCDEIVNGDTYLTPDRWYFFYDNGEDYMVDFNDLSSGSLSTTFYYTNNECNALIEVPSFTDIPTGSLCYIKLSCIDPDQNNCDAHSFDLCVYTIPSSAILNHGESCLNSQSLEGCAERWHSFTATATTLTYTTCASDFGFATSTLYGGNCGSLTVLSSQGASFQECNENQFSGLVPGKTYWIHLEGGNDGCDPDRMTTLCLKMASPCQTDLILSGDIEEHQRYENYKSITLDAVNLKTPGSLYLSATDSITIDVYTCLDSQAPFEAQIIQCLELTCGDGFDDDQDGLTDCDDPDCQNLLPLCSLGGTLFLDANQNGMNQEESGISNIIVQLYNEGDDPTMANPITQTLSDANGEYIFNDLNSSNYFVYISAPISEYPSVSPLQVNLDNGVDNDNNGLQSDLNNDGVTDGPITSPLISLCPGSEPTDDGDDDRSDLTIDIGFTTAGCISLTHECDCFDGIDNDGNGDIDCADPSCGQDICCFIECNCDDGIDNDGDQLADCDDPDCADFTYQFECNCEDGINNDGDQLTDCEDPDCANFIYQYECNCLDGIDNDGDGLIDNDDSEECV